MELKVLNLALEPTIITWLILQRTHTAITYDGTWSDCNISTNEELV